MRILIADDHDLVLDAVRSLLEHELPDADVSVVRTGQAVQSELESGARFDLVLLDLRMPGITGVQDVKEMIANFSDQSFAILSGVAGQMEVNALMDAGARCQPTVLHCHVFHSFHGHNGNLGAPLHCQWDIEVASVACCWGIYNNG